MGALIARAICKKFTVSHTLLSGRPSRVCALPALRGHCADCGLCDTDGLCGLAGLRSPVFARGPFRRFAPTREPRCRERGGRGGAGAGHRQASPRPRPPPTATPATRPAPQAATSRPLVGLLPGERTVRERIGQQLLGMCPTHGPAAPKAEPLRRTAAPARAAPRPRTNRHGVGSPGRGG